MGKYTLKDAAKDTGVSTSQASKNWHKARDDARKSGEITGGGGDGCFIATAAYGSGMHERVQLLRDFRDKALLTRPLGRLLVRFYYRLSQPIASLVRLSPPLQRLVRNTIDCFSRMIGG